MRENQRIRKHAQEKGVYLWEVAERYGCTDFTLSRKLRRELPEAEQARILSIIDEIAERKGN